MSVREYIGARYVPIFANPLQWDSTREYEPLTIVVNNGNSYTSRQYVPIGIDISNENYWALTANYNAQIEQYRHELDAALIVVNRVSDLYQNAMQAYSKLADAVADLNLTEGMIFTTEGRRSVGDGGGGTYIVGNSTPNGYDIISLDSGYSAALMLDDWVTAKQFGAVGDGVVVDGGPIGALVDNTSIKKIKFTRGNYVSGFENRVSNREFMFESGATFTGVLHIANGTGPLLDPQYTSRSYVENVHCFGEIVTSARVGCYYCKDLYIEKIRLTENNRGVHIYFGSINVEIGSIESFGGASDNRTLAIDTSENTIDRPHSIRVGNVFVQNTANNAPAFSLWSCDNVIINNIQILEAHGASRIYNANNISIGNISAITSYDLLHLWGTTYNVNIENISDISEHGTAITNEASDCHFGTVFIVEYAATRSGFLIEESGKSCRYDTITTRASKALLAVRNGVYMLSIGKFRSVSGISSGWQNGDYGIFFADDIVNAGIINFDEIDISGYYQCIRILASLNIIVKMMRVRYGSTLIAFGGAYAQTLYIQYLQHEVGTLSNQTLRSDIIEIS